jgi:hypothetical protein
MVEKRLGDLTPAAKFETAGGVTALTTSGARSHAPRYQSASNRCFGDNLQRIGLRERCALIIAFQRRCNSVHFRRAVPMLEVVVRVCVAMVIT